MFLYGCFPQQGNTKLQAFLCSCQTPGGIYPPCQRDYVKIIWPHLSMLWCYFASNLTICFSSYRLTAKIACEATMSQAPKKYQRSTNGREIWLESDLGWGWSHWKPLSSEKGVEHCLLGTRTGSWQIDLEPGISGGCCRISASPLPDSTCNCRA